MNGHDLAHYAIALLIAIAVVAIGLHLRTEDTAIDTVAGAHGFFAPVKP